MIAMLLGFPVAAQDLDHHYSDRADHHRKYNNHDDVSYKTPSRKHYRRITGHRTKPHRYKSYVPNYYFKNYESTKNYYYERQRSLRDFYIGYGGFSAFYGRNRNYYSPYYSHDNSHHSRNHRQSHREGNHDRGLTYYSNRTGGSHESTHHSRNR